MFVSVGANSTDYIDTSTVVPDVSGQMVANAGVYKHQRRTVPAAPVRLASELTEARGGRSMLSVIHQDPPDLCGWLELNSRPKNPHRSSL